MPRSRNKEADKLLGAVIRARRNEIKMTQHGLAQAIGVTYQQVHKYESGINRVPATTLPQIARALDVPPAFFFEDGPADVASALAAKAARRINRMTPGGQASAMSVLRAIATTPVAAVPAAQP